MKKLVLILMLFCTGYVISTEIDLLNLENYASQSVPAYITKDNGIGNPITDEVATLGRVLFYDKKLSSNNSTACASCHQQAFAFSDTSIVSNGANDVTGRHSMRLINARFSDEAKFFWDERASTLEEQTTMPIRDHGEMGYSGMNGDPDFDDLLDKLDKIDYYDQLFFLAFNDTVVTENRMQTAIAQFIRSIQSFDSKYDAGRAQVNNNGAPFPNFTQDENAGKSLFQIPAQFDAGGSRIAGGLGCGGCHQPPEFDINPNANSNGVMFGVGGGPGNLDTFITRSPTLRDLFNPQGLLNGPLMHNGSFPTIQAAIQHYNTIPDFSQTPSLFFRMDNRLRPNGNPQQLNITPQEMQQLISFLQTLTGSNVYTDAKWSDPFDSTGNLTLVGSPLHVESPEGPELKLFPNPTEDILHIEGLQAGSQIEVFSSTGVLVISQAADDHYSKIQVDQLTPGYYSMLISNDLTGDVSVEKFIKK